LDAWFAGEFELIASELILGELEQVLNYPSIQRRRGWSSERVVNFMRTIREGAQLVDPTKELKVVRDHSDNKFLEAAMAGEAEYIVSLDNDLLTLRQFAEIQIVSPSRFISILHDAP
jgi:putative PIN family toxin of toxin-antitoxin system